MGAPFESPFSVLPRSQTFPMAHGNDLQRDDLLTITPAISVTWNRPIESTRTGRSKNEFGIFWREAATNRERWRVVRIMQAGVDLTVLWRETVLKAGYKRKNPPPSGGKSTDYTLRRDIWYESVFLPTGMRRRIFF